MRPRAHCLQIYLEDNREVHIFGFLQAKRNEGDGECLPARSTARYMNT
jgi:hypothetical protein